MQLSGDVSSAQWIAPRLTGEFGAVTLTVPAGYPAYIRICHPALRRGSDELADWSEVARETGRQTHPAMQWHALVGSPDYSNMSGSLWTGSNPERGNLVPEKLEILCDVLGQHTATPDRCFFCVWDGWGGIREIFSREDLRKPRVRLPHREYLLVTGPIATALKIVGPHFPGWVQSPNLFWPADREWCVASEIDFDSTLVAGTPELVDAILQAPTLDSWPIGPDDSMAADADLINLVPDFDPDSPHA